MLLGFLALWLRSSPEAANRTFDILALQEMRAARFGGAFGTLVFAAVALGFAVKVPVWPFRTWLPDATEAPTVGSVTLAGILLKDGHLRVRAHRPAGPARGPPAPGPR